MKALDTNPLMRYLMDDDVVQGEKIARLFEQAIIKGERFFVSALVIIEAEWVLANVFKVPRIRVIELLLELLSVNVLEIEYHQDFKGVLEYAKNNTYDLSDLFIGAIAQANDCETTLTFDNKASKSPYFEKLI